MYMPAVSIIIVGSVLFILNVLLFFRQYKENLTNPRRKRSLYINGILFISSIGVIALGITEFVIINNQLS